MATPQLNALRWNLLLFASSLLLTLVAARTPSKSPLINRYKTNHFISLQNQSVSKNGGEGEYPTN